MSWQSRNHISVRKRPIFFKVINLTVIIAFVCNITPSQALSNQTLFSTKSHAQRHAGTEAEENLRNIRNDPAAVTIPSAYGLIRESYKGKGDALLVHIQDCHVNEIAQFNIAGMLKALLKDHGIRLLCLEGASEGLDTSFYDTFPDGNTKEKVARFFVEKALFTGAEYFKITNRDKDISAFGVEDKELYLTHLKAYQEAQPDKGRIISYLTGLETALNRVKERIYPGPLKEFEAKGREYKDKIVTLAEYVSYISRSARRFRTDLEPYPNLRDFISLIKKEKDIDFKEAERQRQKLMEELSQRLSRQQLEGLLRIGLDYRLGNIPAVVFYSRLRDLLRTAGYNLKVRNFKDLLLYMEYLELSNRINSAELLDEIEYLNGKIASDLFKNQTDKTVFRYSKSLVALKELHNLSLTCKALDYMDKNPSEFDIERITVFIKHTSAALGIPADFDCQHPYLNAGRLRSAQEFYKIATRRDITIVNNTLERLSGSTDKTAVLITGGFHTAGITNILRQKQISYVVISPLVGMGNYERLYADRMRGIVPDYADILQAASQMLVPALVTGDIVDGLKIKTAFSIAFAGILQSGGLKEILDLNGQRLTLPAIGDVKPLRLEEALEMIKAAIDTKGKAGTEAPLKIVSIPAEGLSGQPPIETGAKAASAGETFSVKKMLKTAVVTAAVGGLTHYGVVVKLDSGPDSAPRQAQAVLKHDPSDTRTPGVSSKSSTKPRPVPTLKESRAAADVTTQKADILSGRYDRASAADFAPQAVSSKVRGEPYRSGMKVASANPQGLPVAPSANSQRPLSMPEAAIPSMSQDTAMIVSQTLPASIFRPGEGSTVHPAVFIAEESLSAEMQLKNYKAAYERVARMVELVFGGRLSEEQKRCWHLLLLGTEATETNFLDSYSGVTPNGNGRYQITGSTAYGIIHNYVTYPIQIKAKDGSVTYRTGMRKELTPLFAEATYNKVSWDAVDKMSKSQLRKLLAADDNFSCLMSLLVYKEVLEREGIRSINADPRALGMLWKQYYNTVYGKGTVERFMKRFELIHKRPSESLQILCRKTNTEYKKLFFERGLGAKSPEREARKSYARFAEEMGLNKDFSKRIITLLRDEYGISPLNIHSKITPFKTILDDKMAHAEFKDDGLVHILIYRKHGELNVRLVVCRDVSQWAKGQEKAAADVILHHSSELYSMLTNPFQDRSKVQVWGKIPQGPGLAAERIPPLSVQRSIGASTVKPAIGLDIIRTYVSKLAAGAKPSSAGTPAAVIEGYPAGAGLLLRERKRNEDILQQA